MERRAGNHASPIRTPVMAGGLFSIDKSYFYEVGSYDPGQDIWGGENVEMSLRIWMCGGEVEILPCSHVGHVFRKNSPHDFPGGVHKVLSTNLARVAEVWLDDWKHFFYKVTPEAREFEGKLDVRDRLELKSRLKCKSFQWYLENIFPEHFFPHNYFTFGQMKNADLKDCLEATYQTHGKHSSLFLSQCAIGDYAGQYFIYSKQHFIRLEENLCFDAVIQSPPGQYPAYGKVALKQCNHIEGGHQKYVYDSKSQTFVHQSSGLCMDKPTVTSGEAPSLLPCASVKSQRWILGDIDWRRNTTTFQN